MRSGGGKGKGSDFERLIGTQLSKWMSNGEHSDWYWRSASSGSHFTTNAKASKYMAGDIAPVDPRGAPLLDVFTIECKHYKDLELDSAVYRPNAAILAFWEQSQRDALKAKKRPMLVARQNSRPILLGLRIHTFQHIRTASGAVRGAFPRAIFFVREQLAVCDWKSFLEAVNPDILKDIGPP